MKVINILLLSIISIGVYAQKSPTDAVFDKYAEKDGFTTVYISKYMFNLFASQDANEDPDDFAKVISGLESIKILTVDDSLLNLKLNLYKELAQDLPFDKYDQLMVIKDKGQDTRMMIRKENGKFREFLMIGGGRDNFLISITGNINLESISKLSKTMNIKELENVDKLDTKTVDKK
ncbi:MAG: DUF4252 domain-containing protein [Bacteroidales bacterium]